MKRILLLLSLTVTAEIPAAWLRAIPDDAREVMGVDAVLYSRASGLNMLQRLDVPLNEADTEMVQYMVYVEREGGAFYLLRMPQAESKEIADGYILVAFDKETAILGFTESVAWAMERLRGAEQENSAIRALADRFDAWAYVPKLFRERTLDKPRKFESELLESVVAVRAGVRFGATVEAHIEVDTKTSEQAGALAVLGKLAPGYLARKRAHGEFGFDLDAIERFVTWAQGSTAFAKVTIPAAAFVHREERRSWKE